MTRERTRRHPSAPVRIISQHRGRIGKSREVLPAEERCLLRHITAVRGRSSKLSGPQEKQGVPPAATRG